jgi:hypothetical protein
MIALRGEGGGERRADRVQARQDWNEAVQHTTQTRPRASYAKLGKQFIAGHWRDGRAGASMEDIDPYNGINILSIALANRRGSDIVKALALGANAVLLGRATLYGLAATGGAGIDHVLHLLKDEVDRTLAQIGCPEIGQLSLDYLTLHANG